VQQHFWHKYSFQGVPNQVRSLEKLRKFLGVGAMTSTPLERKSQGYGEYKVKVPSVGEIWIFSGTTQYVFKGPLEKWGF